MTKAERRSFIHGLVASVKESLIEDLSRVPEEWDGHELRWWIADRFKHRARFDSVDNKRLRDYRNEVLVRNL